VLVELRRTQLIGFKIVLDPWVDSNFDVLFQEVDVMATPSNYVARHNDGSFKLDFLVIIKASHSNTSYANRQNL
jgi:hypothetical protein